MRRAISTLRAVALLLLVVTYLAGGYGLVTNLEPVAAVWQIVIAACAYSGLFAAVGWAVYGDGT